MKQEKRKCIYLKNYASYGNIFFYSNTKFDALSYETKLSSLAGIVFEIYAFPVLLFYLRLLKRLKL